MHLICRGMYLVISTLNFDCKPWVVVFSLEDVAYLIHDMRNFGLVLPPPMLLTERVLQARLLVD